MIGVFHEITVGATFTKYTTYKEQATEFFEEASTLNRAAEILDLMCNWMVSANIPLFKFQMPKFWSFWKSTANNQSTLQKHYLSICYEETLENIRGNIGDASI
jgi:hypothetical protein